MGMGIVSDSEFDLELKNSNLNSSPKESEIESRAQIIDKSPRGRGEGNLQVPDSLRKIIGEESSINGRTSALAIADMFSISPSSVSAYNNGATSTKSYDTPNPALQNHINNARQRIANRAKKKLHLALNNITDEKLSSAKLEVISGVARDMAGIIKTMEPSQNEDKDNDTRKPFVIFAPVIRDERSYEVINVNEI